MKKLLFMLLSLCSISTYPMLSKITLSSHSMPKNGIKKTKLLTTRKYSDKKESKDEEAKSVGFDFYIRPLTQKELEMRRLQNEIMDLHSEDYKVQKAFKKLKIKKNFYIIGLPLLASTAYLNSGLHRAELSFILPIIGLISWVDYERTILEMNELESKNREMVDEYYKLRRMAKELSNEIIAERNDEELKRSYDLND